MSTNEAEQIEHSNTIHAKKLAKQKTEKSTVSQSKEDSDTANESSQKNFQICKSKEVLTIILKKCFYDFYCCK